MKYDPKSLQKNARAGDGDKVHIEPYEKAFLFSQRIINSCDDIEHIKVCKNLISNFKKTYKNKMAEKEMNEAIADLEKLLVNKKNSIRFRKHYQKKNGH